jgi:hypothetical protein
VNHEFELSGDGATVEIVIGSLFPAGAPPSADPIQSEPLVLNPMADIRWYRFGWTFC